MITLHRMEQPATAPSADFHWCNRAGGLSRRAILSIWII